MTRSSFMPLAAATVACVSGAAFGQSLVCTGVSVNRLSADGMTTVGQTYNASLQEHEIRRFVVGVGHTLLAGAYWEGDNVSCSDDGSVVTMGAGNFANWGSLNCFNGTNPPIAEPCPIRNIAHRYTVGGGWQDIGGFSQVEIPVGSGVFFDQTRCDFTINTAAAVSGDGSYVVGAGWIDTVSPYGGICGKFRAYRYDSGTGGFAMLPTEVGAELTATTRADDVNGDGNVIVGYHNTAGNRLAVWESNGGPDVNGNADMTLTVLGTSNYTSGVVNRAGDVIASSTGTMLERWVKTGGVWTLEALGSPVAYINPAGVSIPLVSMFSAAVSDDGNTIVGAAVYNNSPSPSSQIRRAFIWRPSINGGVPIDLQAYIESISPGMLDGIDLGQPADISADGNAILLGFTDRRNTCPTDEFIQLPISHNTGNTGILYLNEVTCDPPRISLSPFDHVQTSQTNLGVSLNIFASGSWPMTFQWQKEDPMNPGTWVDLQESCADFDANLLWAYEGTTKNQLRIGTFEGGSDRAGNYRCIVSNSCGSIVSDSANVSFVVGACCIPGNACYIEYQSRCASAGGVWGGTDSNCDVDPCAVVPCCLPGSICTDTTALDCAAQGGTAGPAGQSCFSFVCAAYCDADWCEDGQVGVPDIFCFLSDWFAQIPEAIGYGGTPGVPAIFAFLAEWFATPQGNCVP